MTDNIVSPLLSVNDLSIAFNQGKATRPVVNNISFSIFEKETLALVGESGSGKSITALSILKLLSPQQVSYPSGDIVFEGQSLLHAPEKTLRQVRGNKISMIFQEPMVSLNPLHTIEKQLYEVLSLHRGMRANTARSEIITYLERVGIKNAKNRLSAYPHELSGGERQRVMIAMAILTHPKLLIADEPTTALDVSVQAQIVQLLKELRNELDMSLLFITHNLGLVKKLADNIAVMHKGQIVEQNNRHRLFLRPENYYTKVLLASEPTGDPVPLPENSAVLMNIHDLCVDVVAKKKLFSTEKKRIVDHASITLHQGETVGIVGESGSGKSTTALAIMRLIKSTGEITFDAQPLHTLSHKKLLPYRSQIQIIFQDPFSSLNPRFTVEQIISEGLQTHTKLSKDERTQAVIEMMREVGLDPDTRHRYPNEFSGGQRQRIAIARALILKPQVLILDEPTSSLDRTVQVYVLNLLKELQARHKLTYLFISHDLAVIHSMCHQVIVMKDGKIVEAGSRDQIFNQPETEYTKTLISFMDKPLKRTPTPKTDVESQASSAEKPVKKKKSTNWSDALLMR
ncbi:microcin C ABC transporter ATP-binding protein YejF [Zophobihabitans entericus]|uniref:Microcin C ABC transporter ATP-binding protein YejF n=1 Tax=Zophobihabitans entericus TaxID=1635327 RepID=A0A6G9IAS3_9GAMM|nr:microcin C ABC transporter ATP-binding protein YejF [Zophobihabitans entericus]QIQ20932.1 microcin C ABC transporter ATP-binding protein YejF [Zophobihabitans entericus]